MPYDRTIPDHPNSLVICVNVIACNHLILSLKEAGGCVTSSKPIPPSDVVFATQTSDMTHTYDTRSKAISLPQHDVSTDWDIEIHQTPKLGAWHEMQPVRGSTTRVSFEVI